VKKLVLYSDQIPPLADDVDKELATLVGIFNPKIGYISSRADPQRKYYRERQAYYSRIGMDLQVYFELDNEFRPDLLEPLLSCHAIHLSGGDVFYFLHWLHRRGIIEPLRRYVNRGGVLVGVSAGSILMGPDISVRTVYPPFSAEVGDDLSCLCLVDFAFVPHYDRKRNYDILPALQKYSLEYQRVVYACPDSAGIVVTDDDVKCIGDVLKIDAGKG
jgi:dipeptidase E